MTKREGQTTQWPKEKDRKHNGQKRRTDNTMAKRIVLFVLLFWPLCCLSSFGHCIVCPSLLTIVLSVLLFWPLCCLSSFGHYIVCPLLAIVLSVLFWLLRCLAFSFGHCVVCPCLLVCLIVFSALSTIFQLYRGVSFIGRGNCNIYSDFDLWILITPLVSSNFSYK
jgi:hypothetical protein